MKPVRLTLQILLPVVILAGGVFAMLALAGLREEPEQRAPQVERPVVETVVARRVEVPITIDARGTVEPRAETRLLAEVRGRVLLTSPSLVNGGFFASGETLLTIDDTDYQLALREAELAVSQARLKLEQVRADADLALSEWKRLGREGQPSALTLREPQLAEATAALEAASARVSLAQRDVERCTVTAPYDGRVRSEHVDVGQLLVAGAEIASVYAIDAAEVRLLLPDADLLFLDLPLGGAPTSDGIAASGPEVALSADFAGVEHEWSATIVRTEGELDPATRMVVAVARVDDPFGREAGAHAGRTPLAPGMFVSARIDGRAVLGMPLPRAALRGADEVFVVEDGRLTARSVEVVRAERDSVIVGSGIEDGAHVVVSPLATSYDGMPVEERSTEGAER